MLLMQLLTIVVNFKTLEVVTEIAFDKDGFFIVGQWS